MTENKLDTDQINWGAYYLNKGREMMIEEKLKKQAERSKIWENLPEKLVYAFLMGGGTSLLAMFVVPPIKDALDVMWSLDPSNVFNYGALGGFIGGFLAYFATSLGRVRS